MPEDAPHVLVVAHRTAATPRLMEAVRRRAQGKSCTFTLLVPKPYWDPDTEEAELVVELAVPLLEQAAGRRVDAVIGDSDPVEAVRQLVSATAVDEVIVSTLPERVSRWLRRDVPSRLRALGLPVTVVTAEQSSRSLLGGAER
jgi:Mrp family chromosome partitioning ATPase